MGPSNRAGSHSSQNRPAHPSPNSRRHPSNVHEHDVDYVTDSDDEDRGHHLGIPIRSSNVSLVGSYQRPSFTFGQARPSFTPGSPISTSLAALPSPEKERVLEQQNALLQDNRLLPSYKPRSRRSSFVSTVFSAAPDESTSLLGELNASVPDWEAAVEAKAIHTTFARELKVIGQYSLPLYVTFLLQYSLTVASIFSAGNLGKNELAGVSLASMTAVITGYAPYQGFSTALDTLCAQAYGSGNKHLVGLHLQRMVMFLMLMSIPIIAIWQFSETILNWILPEPELARFASLYLRILSLGAPGFAIFECSKRFLQAQGLFAASTYVLLICAPLNGVLNYLLVWSPRIGFGFAGAPTSVVIINWLMPLLLFLYVRYVRGYECWGGFSQRSFTNWAPMIKLAIPGFIMLEAEYLAFEILTLAASYLGTAHVAAQSVLSTTTTMTFQLPFAVSIATSTRVANFLGATLGDAAQTTAKLGVMVAAAVGIFNSIFVLCIRHQFVRLFSSDPEVIELYVQAIPIGAAFQFFDAIGVCTAGILRGQGRQKIGSYINLVVYYALGIPLSLVLAYTFELELVGLWTGLAVSLFTIAMVELVIIYYSEWDNLVEDAKAMVMMDS